MIIRIERFELLSLSIFTIIYTILFETNEKNFLTNKNSIFSRISTAYILATATIGLLGILIIFFGISQFPIFLISLFFLISTVIYKKKYLRNFKNLFKKIYFKEFLIPKQEIFKNKRVYFFILFIVIWLILLSFGPINSADGSALYVGYPYQFWSKNEFINDYSGHIGLKGIADFANIAFFQEKNIWLIRTTQALPIPLYVLYALKRKGNKLILITLLCSPVFIQWLTVGRPLFVNDICLLISYLVWDEEKNNENLSYLLITSILNVSFKITGILIVFPIITHIFFDKKLYKNIDSLFELFNRIENKRYILLSLIILFTIFFYRYKLTGNFLYPVFNNLVYPNNHFYSKFTEGLSEYRRGFLFPLWMIIPKNTIDITQITGLGTGFIIISIYFYLVRKSNKFLVPITQIILLLLFCQGRSNYYTFPIFYLACFKVNNASIWIGKKILKKIFSIFLVIQFINFFFVTAYSQLITINSVIDYEKSMKKNAHNYSFSKLINKEAKVPFINLVNRHNYLFSKYNQASNQVFKECIANFDNSINKNKYKYCAEKFNIKTLILNKNQIFDSDDFVCKKHKFNYASRNFLLHKSKEIEICNLSD